MSGKIDLRGSELTRVVAAAITEFLGIDVTDFFVVFLSRYCLDLGWIFRVRQERSPSQKRFLINFMLALQEQVADTFEVGRILKWIAVQTNMPWPSKREILRRIETWRVGRPIPKETRAEWCVYLVAATQAYCNAKGLDCI